MPWAPCRDSSDPRPMLANGNLNLNSYISDIPYIGDYFIGVLQQRGFVRVRDVRNYFQHLSAANIHRRLSEMLRNPRRQQCDRNHARLYHVPDVNQCAFNSIILTLQHFNVAGAAAVPLRSRGNTVQVRDCACHATRNDCQGNGCRWRTQNQTRLPGGRCIPPAAGNQGFSGYGQQDRYDQRTNRVPSRNQVTVVNGDGGPHYYVQNWRVLPGQVIPLRRSTRNRGGPRLLACGTNVPTNVPATIPQPDPRWSDATAQMWARAVVDRYT